MSFLDPDERLIIMDISGSIYVQPNLLTPEELKQLADVGVKTIYFQGAFHWDEMQAGPDQPICWDRLDRYIDNIESAGLKVLLPFLYTCPRWKPADWFLLYLEIPFPSCPSYTNAVTAAELDDVLRVAIERYRGRPAQFIYSIPIDGEFAFPLVPNRSIPEFPEEIFIQWILDRQKIFKAQFGEIWTAFHLIDDPPWADRLYAALSGTFPLCDHYAIQFTYFGMSPQHNQRVHAVSEQFGVRYFCGSEYVQGLRTTVPACIDQGLRGLICASVYPSQNNQRLTSWMLNEIEWAMGALNVH